MKKTTESAQTHVHSQLDQTLELARLAFGYCEAQTEINTTAARKFIAQVDIDRAALLNAETTGFAVASGRLALTFWSSTLACGLDVQRRIFAGLARQ